MGGGNVKNTIVERALQIVAPHPCCGCGKIGLILCQYCKYDIINESFGGCILCNMPEKGGICPSHLSSIERAFVVGARDDVLEKIIDSLKFYRTKAAASALAELLDASLPLLPAGSVLIPIPTISKHIRQRGYDQVELVTRHLGALRGVPVVSALKRKTSDVQHLAGRKQRWEQAGRAFELDKSVDIKSFTALADRSAPIVLVDDITTTGSTLSAAADLLATAGARVWAVAVAAQEYHENQ